MNFIINITSNTIPQYRILHNLALTAGQYVQVLFETTDTGTPNITIDDVNLSIVQIGA